MHKGDWYFFEIKVKNIYLRMLLERYFSRVTLSTICLQIIVRFYKMTIIIFTFLNVLLLYSIRKVSLLTECRNTCSGRGRCHYKYCECDTFWMENFLRVYAGDGVRNCGSFLFKVIYKVFKFNVYTLPYLYSFFFCQYSLIFLLFL